METAQAELDQMFSMIRATYNVDLAGYASTSFVRRMERFFSLHFSGSVAELSKKLTESKDYFDFFIKEITVNTTEMFRDPECWKVLRQDVLPLLAGLPSVRIWHAGCSSGEEVFSMAILLKEAGLYNNAQIVATDLNRQVLRSASEGVYPLRSLALNAANYLSAGGTGDFKQYYDADTSGFVMKPELLANVKFLMHDLSAGALFSKFDLILCRNVMIYFNKDLQERVFSLFGKSLFKRGFLVIGKKESMAYYSCSSEYQEFNAAEKIYRHL